jgi:hypothetical protein
MEYVEGRKSRHSRNAWDCVEIGTFRQSSRCDKDCCVQVGSGPEIMGFRDTKQLNKTTGKYQGATLEVTVPAYNAFLEKIKSGAAGD